MHICFYRHILRSKINMTPQKVLNFDKMSAVFLYCEKFSAYEKCHID